jgi:two-component system LytT family response regulator
MIRCIALDDEPIALKQITRYIGKTPFLELCGEFENAFDAMEFLHSNQVDLMFVDINMPDLSGMDFVKSLEKAPKVVFTTAYSEYAVEGFKVDALDYILKPIAYSDFLRAANKAEKYCSLQPKVSDEVKTEKDFLMIKSEHKIVRLNLNDIKYIEGMREYVRFHLLNQKPIMSLMSMKNLEAILPESGFMRVHRSYIVNLEKITVIERSRIIFDRDVYIPVSEQYKAKFQEYIDNNFLI